MLHLSKMDFERKIPDVMFCLSIREDMTWVISSCGVEITMGKFIQSLPTKLNNVLYVTSVVTRLSQCHICMGNADGKFQELQTNSRFLHNSGMMEWNYVIV